MWLFLLGILFLSGFLASCTAAHDGSYAAHVWLDSNQNGKQDQNEKPLTGVVIQIVNPSTGDLWTRSVTDDKGDIYLFSAGGTCGQYNLYLSVPEGYWPTTPVVANTPHCETAQFGLRQSQ